VISGVNRFDPVLYGPVFVCMGMVTLAAGIFPARRAMSFDPMENIRAD